MPMRHPFPPPDDPLDRAVRAQLEAEARTTDADRVLSQALDRADREARWPRRWRVLVPLALAASLLLVLFATLTTPPAQAGPAEVLQRAQLHHAQALDNAYQFTVEAAEGA